MIIVGLTGGIASGKTFISNYLKSLKIPVHESDFVVEKLYKVKDKNFIRFLNNFGFKGAIINNKIDKTVIRDEIFKSKNKKNNLEKYIHLHVSKSRNVFLKKNKKKKIIFLDIPLLFEKNLAHICDYTCSIIAPVNIRRKRALQRKNMSNKAFNQIIKNQTTDKERKKKSHYLIRTNVKKQKTYLQVDNIIYDILYNN